MVVHVRATGSQLFAPQWVAAVSSVHCTQVPASQTFSFGPVHWSASLQGAQVFVARSQREAIGSVQSVSAVHATHAPARSPSRTHTGVSGKRAQSGRSSQGTQARVVTSQRAAAGSRQSVAASQATH